MLPLDIAFYSMAAVMVGSALGVVLMRDIFRAALFLVLSFLVVAGLFVLLNAEFLAVVQVLIYVGAISILLIFAIMLTRNVQEGNPSNGFDHPARILSAMVLAALVFVAVTTDWNTWDSLGLKGFRATRRRPEQHGAGSPGRVRQHDARNSPPPASGVRASLRSGVRGAAGGSDRRARPGAGEGERRLSLENLLILSAIIFSIGLYGTLSKRNVIAVLMSIELMFNAVNIAAIAFARYVVPRGIAVDPVAAENEIGQALTEGISLGDTVLSTLLTGQIFSIFIITIAAAEVALGLGIVIALYRNRETVDVTRVNLMRG